MAISRYVVPFALGMAAGAWMHKNWDQIREVAGPAGQKLLEGGSEMLEQGRQKFYESSEKFSDMMNELRAEEMEEADATPTPEAKKAAS